MTEKEIHHNIGLITQILEKMQMTLEVMHQRIKLLENAEDARLTAAQLQNIMGGKQ